MEDLEQIRIEAMQSTVRAMADIAKEGAIEVKDRIEAAKVLNKMSDDIVKHQFVDQAFQAEKTDRRKVLKKLDDLGDKLSDREP
jgi:hypothetical protein